MNNPTPNLPHTDLIPFSQLPLRAALLDNLASLGYETMTPIQMQSLPLMLNGEDVLAKAKTGSGKTAAFGLSALHHLKVEHFAVQALVLCPTRELAEQVSQALRRLARLMPNVKILNLSGGIPMKPQLDSLRHGAHIIVGTPGRVQKHLIKGTLSLSQLQTLVLDEADRMLDMGFFDDIKAIISSCPKKRQTLLFSATYPPEIKSLSQQFMQHPKEVLIDTHHAELDIEQRFYEVGSSASKFPLLKALLLHYKPTSALIFCNKKQQTTDLAESLTHAGFSALALNGDMEQSERDQVIIRFINQSCSILVATDVAARGIDIKELPAVINYDLAFDHDVHIHRIGRTGRAGHQGLALTLATPAEAPRVCLIEENLPHPLVWATIDSLASVMVSPVRGHLSNLRKARMPFESGMDADSVFDKCPRTGETMTEANSLDTSDAIITPPAMITICLDAGRKDKIRPGDILGALTKDAGLPADVIGKIDIAALCSYVAIHRSHADKAYRYFQNGKLKGRKVNVKKLR